MDGIALLDVFEKKGSGIVYHRLPDSPQARALKPGMQVTCILDWDRRLTHMQIHSAEHLVSGLIWKMYGGANKGFHMGKDYATIDILLPESSGPEFSEEMLEQVEIAANKAVWENAEIVTRFCTSREEAAAHPLRKPMDLDEDISVVVIGSHEEPYDCCACCGTHVPRTGSIGLIKLMKAENYKGMARITLTAGLPAYRDAALRQKITAALCGRHSTEIEHLMERIDIQESKNGAARKELYDLKKDLLQEENRALLEIWAAPPSGKEASIFVHRYRRYSADDLQTLARSLEKELIRPTAFVSERETTAVLASSGNPDCGKLVREYAGLYGGKGGGNDRLARAIFHKQEDLDLFLDLIEKHLR
jgi:alanyl-tRNA synthetase